MISSYPGSKILWVYMISAEVADKGHEDILRLHSFQADTAT
jgi:hypothetical protein